MASLQMWARRLVVIDRAAGATSFAKINAIKGLSSIRHFRQDSGGNVAKPWLENKKGIAGHQAEHFRYCEENLNQFSTWTGYKRSWWPEALAARISQPTQARGQTCWREKPETTGWTAPASHAKRCIRTGGTKRTMSQEEERTQVEANFPAFFHSVRGYASYTCTACKLKI